MGHIVLLGDSVFDNAAYVGPRQEVVEKVRSRMEPGWDVRLLAQDGAVIADVLRQVERVPSNVTHLFISAGGNDALGQVAVFDEAVGTVGGGVARLAAIGRQFQKRYQEMLDVVLSHEVPTTICTIYDVRFPELDLREIANTALAVLNDVITREAVLRGLPVLDLRVLFDEASDFANPIEPSARGGEKLGRAIAEVVAHHDFTSQRSTAFAAPRHDKHANR